MKSQEGEKIGNLLKLWNDQHCRVWESQSKQNLKNLKKENRESQSF